MAQSGYIDVTVNSQNTLRFSWSVASQDSIQNCSVVNWQLDLIAGSSGRIGSTAKKDYSVTVNGQTWIGTNKIGIGNNETLTLISDSVTIPHNSDGTKTFSFSFSQEIAITWGDGTYFGTYTGSGNGTLPDISRGAVIVACSQSLSLPGTSFVQWYAVPGNSYRLTFSCGNWSMDEWGLYPGYEGLHTEYWNIPLEAAQGFSGQSGYVTVTLTTWADNACTQQIGAASGTQMSVYVPENDDTRPTVTIAEITETGSGVGVFTAGKSRAVIRLSCEVKYGASLGTRTVTVDGKQYTMTNDTLTTNVLTTTGSVKVSASVQDSRDFSSNTATSNITVYEYGSPGFSEVICKRCDENGEETSDGTYLKLFVRGWYYALSGKNSRSLSYAVDDGNEKELQLTDISSSNFCYVKTEELIIDATLSKTKSYRVTLKITDGFGAYETTARVIPSEEIFSHERKNSIGYGGYVDKENTAAFHWGIQPINGFDLDKTTAFINTWEELDTFITQEMIYIPMGRVKTYQIRDLYTKACLLTIFCGANGDGLPSVLVTLETPDVLCRKTGYSEGYGEDGAWDYLWGEWEYENPPMVEDVEYRTTERFNGKPVYTKLINFGMIDDTDIEMDIGIYGIGGGGNGLVGYQFFTNCGRTLPCGVYGEGDWWGLCNISDGKIKVAVGSGLAGNNETLYAIVKYIVA